MTKPDSERPPSARTVDRRLKAARIRASRTAEFLSEIGPVGPIVRSLVDRLTTIDLLLTRMEDRLAQGHVVDLERLGALINSQIKLTASIRQAVTRESGGQAMSTMTRADLEDVRARLAFSHLADEIDKDFLDLITGWHLAREQGIELSEFITQQRNAAKLRDAIDSTGTLLLPAPDANVTDGGSDQHNSDDQTTH
jgi:hypothetical protein